MRRRIHDWLQRTWYGDGKGYRLLLPLSGLYWLVVTLRRWLYRAGLFKRVRLGVPVIVVGNLTAGGTGKTPTTIWLARALATHGFRCDESGRGGLRPRGSGRRLRTVSGRAS